MRLWRWLVDLVWSKAGTPEEEAARAEAMSIRASGRNPGSDGKIKL